ncbi:HAD family hydrolase [Barrientosiimonas humi]|uniref:HAD family hydrolase n=1 Tax=Barrientosiimonas humi TaxID=999931 RepID=UPI00370DADCF
MAESRWPAAVFDLDGTLVDTVPLIVASYQHAFRTHLGREEDEALIRSWIGQPLIRAFRLVDETKADALYDTYIGWNQDNTERLIRPFEGAAELLTALHDAGVTVAVATSKRRPQAQRALELTGLAGLVEPTVTLEDTDAHKPDPAPILLACERIGVAPERAVYVGDAAVDVRAGASAGLSTIAVTWGAGTGTDLAGAAPTETAHSFAELRSLLLR